MEPQPKNIDNLSQAVAQVYAISKDHTVYRSIVSLDEETAIQKEYTGREQWQRLINDHIAAIAKENGIEIQDMRWCAAYHHERGHPHVHIAFWDSSNRVRNEFMGEERFAIATEKIRASFNGEIFRAELKALRSKQDTAKQQLRARSRNIVEGYTDLTFLSREEPDDFLPVNCYPKELKVEQAGVLCQRLEELLYLLPEKGQLKYQYLSGDAKRAVSLVGKILLERTTLNSLREELLRTVEEIAATYGNAPEAVARQKAAAEKQLIKDIGNDILSALVKSGWLERREQSRLQELTARAHARAIAAADAVLAEKMNAPAFRERLQALAGAMGTIYTPKPVVLQGEGVSALLRSLTLECLDAERLRAELHISQALAERGGEAAQKKNATWEAAYRYVSDRLYDRAADQNGWTTQQRQMDAVRFLLAFCRLASGNQRLNSSNKQYLLRRELSKQAKKERYLESKDSSHLWEAEPWY